MRRNRNVGGKSKKTKTKTKKARPVNPAPGQVTEPVMDRRMIRAIALTVAVLVALPVIGMKVLVGRESQQQLMLWLRGESAQPGPGYDPRAVVLKMLDPEQPARVRRLGVSLAADVRNRYWDHRDAQGHPVIKERLIALLDPEVEPDPWIREKALTPLVMENNNIDFGYDPEAPSRRALEQWQHWLRTKASHRYRQKSQPKEQAENPLMPSSPREQEEQKVRMLLDQGLSVKMGPRRDSLPRNRQ
jgi:hypothetical protein